MPLSWNEFSSSTTVHGLRFLNKDTSLKRRIIWSILILTATGFLFSQVYESVRRFSQFKVNTVIHLTNDGKTKYPSITVCNANTLRKSKLNEPPFKNDIRVKGWMQLSKQVIFDTNLTALGIDNSSGYSISGEDLQHLYLECGHTMKPVKDGGMLEYCRAPNHAQCDYNNFTTMLTYTGLCYTLNSDTHVDEGIFASASGRFSSVRLKLSVQVDEYSLSVGNSESIGITVLVHDQLDPPFADTHGILIGPGVHASIAIKKTKFESLKHPYESKCRDENLSELIPYSRLACLRMCEENFVIENCKCKMPVDTVNTRNDVPLCNASQIISCGIPAETTLFPAQKNECDCPFACHSVEYTTTMSQAPYPTETRGREQAFIDLKKKKKNITEENIQVNYFSPRERLKNSGYILAENNTENTKPIFVGVHGSGLWQEASPNFEFAVRG